MPAFGPDEFRRLTRRLLPPEVTEAWLSHARPTVALVRAEGDEPATRSHHSRLGGQPMVDPDFAWPRTDGRPYALLAVINLATLVGADALDVLPDRGYLNLFADIDSTLLGVSPERLGGLVLEHAKGGLYEQRHTPPAVHQTVAVAVEAVEHLSLPHPSEPVLAGLQAEYRPKLDKVWDAMLDTVGAPRHRLFGWPDLVCGPLVGLPKLRAQNWVMLAQIDSDDELEWSWGNVGRLFVLIGDKDLPKGRFDRCHAVIQSY